MGSMHGSARHSSMSFEKRAASAELCPPISIVPLSRLAVPHWTAVRVFLETSGPSGSSSVIVAAHSPSFYYNPIYKHRGEAHVEHRTELGGGHGELLKVTGSIPVPATKIKPVRSAT